MGVPKLQSTISQIKIGYSGILALIASSCFKGTCNWHVPLTAKVFKGIERGKRSKLRKVERTKMVTGNKIYNIGPKVTGAGSGIGRKLSLRLAELGAEVYAVSKTESRLESLRFENASIRTICIDLADWKATREALSELPVTTLWHSTFGRVFWLSSVTRFGENSPLWQYFTSLWQLLGGLFLIWQNNKSTLANLLHYWTNFHCWKWPNIESLFNHLVPLILR